MAKQTPEPLMENSFRLRLFVGLAVLTGCGPRAPIQTTHTAVTTSRPIQWGVTGDARSSYALQGVSDDGHAVSLHRLLPGTGFGATVASLDAAPFRGRRIRYSTVLRAESAIPGAASWLRIDGDNSRQIALENNYQRSLHGTVDWTEQVTELDVPEDAQRILFGLLLYGDGTVHARDVIVQVVDRVVAPLTWRIDRVSGTSPFYVVADTAGSAHAVTLERMAGGSLMDNEFGTATATAPAASFSGRRVTVRAMMRTRDASAATLWVRADGGGRTLALENNMTRPVTGTTEWTEKTAIVDFPAATETVAYGLLLLGRGSASLRDITMSSAPITGVAMPGLPMRQ